MNPYEQLDKLVRDVAVISGQVATLFARLEKLENRQAKAFGAEKHETGNTLHLPPKGRVA